LAHLTVNEQKLHRRATDRAGSFSQRRRNQKKRNAGDEPQQRLITARPKLRKEAKIHKLYACKRLLWQDR